MGAAAVLLTAGACSAVDRPPFSSADGLRSAVAASVQLVDCAPADDETGGESLICQLSGEPVLLTAYFGAETLEQGRAWLDSQGWTVTYGDGWTIASRSGDAVAQATTAVEALGWAVQAPSGARG